MSQYICKNCGSQQDGSGPSDRCDCLAIAAEERAEKRELEEAEREAERMHDARQLVGHLAGYKSSQNSHRF